MRFLLLSGDAQLIQEFEKLCAVGEVELTTVQAVSEMRSHEYEQVFIDASSIDLSINSFATSNVSIVHFGRATPIIWKLAARLDVAAVISLPADREVVLALCEPKLMHRAIRICVASQVGGVGASTFAGALAGNLASLGHRVLLVDATNRNQRLDLAFGVSENPTNILEALDTCSANDLVRMLPVMDEVYLVTSLGANPAQLAKFVNLVEANFDYLVLDAGQNAASINADLELRMTTNTIAAAALTRDANRVEKGELALVVRMVSGAGLSAIDIAEHTKIPLWATVPMNQAIVEHVEQGLGITNLYRTSLRKPLEAVLERLDFGQEVSAAA